MSTYEFLQQLPEAFKPEEAEGVQCTVTFNTENPASMSINNGTCSVDDGAADAPDVTLNITEENLVALLKGELNGMAAFMSGKLQVDGDLMQAQKITNYFDRDKIS